MRALSTRVRRRTRGCHPILEALEQRQLLAVPGLPSLAPLTAAAVAPVATVKAALVPLVTETAQAIGQPSTPTAVISFVAKSPPAEGPDLLAAGGALKIAASVAVPAAPLLVADVLSPTVGAVAGSGLESGLKVSLPAVDAAGLKLDLAAPLSTGSLLGGVLSPTALVSGVVKTAAALPNLLSSELIGTAPVAGVKLTVNLTGLIQTNSLAQAPAETWKESGPVGVAAGGTNTTPPADSGQRPNTPVGNSGGFDPGIGDPGVGTSDASAEGAVAPAQQASAVIRALDPAGATNGIAPGRAGSAPEIEPDLAHVSANDAAGSGDGAKATSPVVPRALFAVPSIPIGTAKVGEGDVLAGLGGRDQQPPLAAPGVASAAAARQVAPPGDGFADELSEVPAPAGSELQGGAAPLEAAALERALRQFLDQLSDSGQLLQTWFGQLGPLSWFVIGTALATLTQEVIRRRLRKARRRGAPPSGDDLHLALYPDVLGIGD